MPLFGRIALAFTQDRPCSLAVVCHAASLLEAVLLQHAVPFVLEIVHAAPKLSCAPPDPSLPTSIIDPSPDATRVPLSNDFCRFTAILRREAPAPSLLPLLLRGAETASATLASLGTSMEEQSLFGSSQVASQLLQQSASAHGSGDLAKSVGGFFAAAVGIVGLGVTTMWAVKRRNKRKRLRRRPSSVGEVVPSNRILLSSGGFLGRTANLMSLWMARHGPVQDDASTVTVAAPSPAKLV
jgi:hypothetical protein